MKGEEEEVVARLCLCVCVCVCVGGWVGGWVWVWVWVYVCGGWGGVLVS